MGRLWTALKAHRQSAWRFAGFWGLVSLVEAVVFLIFAPGGTTRSRGEMLTLAFSVSLPFLAGAVVASWGRGAPPVLAGSLVSLINVAWLMALDPLSELVHPSTPGLGAEAVTWVGFLVQLAVFLLLGVIIGAGLAYLGTRLAQQGRTAHR